MKKKHRDPFYKKEKILERLMLTENAQLTLAVDSLLVVPSYMEQNKL